MRHFYDLRQETEGTWAVFNMTTGLTAYVRGAMQRRLSRTDADLIANCLNRMGGKPSRMGGTSSKAPAMIRTDSVDRDWLAGRG